MSEGTRLTLVKDSQGHLRAADPETAESLKAFAQGELVPVKVYKERNPGFHKKFFALLNTAYENQERYTDRESFRAAVTVAAGWFIIYAPADGSGLVKYPKSIAWDKMDDVEFQKLYKAALDAIISYFIPGADPEAFNEAIDDVMRFA